MRVARGVLSKKMIPALILGLISLSIAIFTPPTSLPVILIFIMCLSLFFSLVAKQFTSHKYALLTFIFAFVILTLFATGLFDPINITLAVSLLIGVSILIK